MKPYKVGAYIVLKRLTPDEHYAADYFFVFPEQCSYFHHYYLRRYRSEEIARGMS